MSELQNQQSTHFNYNYDYRFNFALVGDSDVGKSSLLLGFADGSYPESDSLTSDTNFRIHHIHNNNAKKIRLELWDTVAPKSFEIGDTPTYKDFQGILLVYDITNITSYNSIQKWIKNCESTAPENCQWILVGTKSDLTAKRQVGSDIARAYAKKLGIPFVEVSAKNDENVETPFHLLTDQVLKKLHLQESKESKVRQPAAKATTSHSNTAKIGMSVGFGFFTAASELTGIESALTHNNKAMTGVLESVFSDAQIAIATIGIALPIVIAVIAIVFNNHSARQPSPMVSQLPDVGYRNT